MPKNQKRDAIIAHVTTRPDIRPHPAQKEIAGTKYIAAYLNERGTVFAVDKTTTSKQPIWFLDGPHMRDALEGAGIAYDFYPPERGRNSNLHKLPGFEKGSLLRAFPETVDEALCVIEWLCQPSR